MRFTNIDLELQPMAGLAVIERAREVLKLHERSERVVTGELAKAEDRGPLQIQMFEPVGYGIAERIQQISRDVLQVQQGSLYPALHRLEQQGWIKASWGESETGRKAKFYALTRPGRTQMDRELANWERLSAAINLVTGTT
jgi:transcriptional regulator